MRSSAVARPGVSKPISAGGMAVEVDNVTRWFGGTLALDHVSLQIPGGSITGLVGPNGSGKTTLLRCITGFLQPSSGAVRVFGQTGLGPGELYAHGVAQTFQRLALAEDMTVAENIALALDGKTVPNPRRLGLHLVGADRGLDGIDPLPLLAAVSAANLEAYVDEVVGTLPLGVRRRVELGRALAAQPRLLLLDEPTSGLDERETSLMAEMIARVAAESDLAVVLVEHDMTVVARLCENLIVLETGHVIFDGPVAAALEDAGVRQAYLGT